MSGLDTVKNFSHSQGYITHGLYNQFQQSQSTQSANDSMIDLSITGNRLVQSGNGTVQMIPNTPSEVFGKIILRPLLDNSFSICSKVVTTLQEGFTSLDRVLTKAFNFIPGAEATPTNACQNEQELTEFTFINSAWKAVEIRPKTYSEFLATCAPEQKIHILNNIAFQNIYSELIQIMNDLTNYINEKGQNYEKEIGKAQEECTTLKTVELSLKRELDNLSDYFQPTTNKRVLLTLPKSSTKREFSLTVNGLKIAPYHLPNDSETAKNACQENPIVRVLMNALPEYISMLSAFNIQEGTAFSFDQFVKLFSSEDILANTKKQAEKFKKFYDSEMGKLKDLSNTYIKKRESDFILEIRNNIHFIYQKHCSELQKKDNKGWYEIKQTKTNGASCIGWEVTQIGRISNGKGFTFELIE